MEQVMGILVFNPDTFAFLDEECLLVYDSKYHAYLEIPRTNFAESLYASLLNVRNMNSYELSAMEYNENKDTVMEMLRLKLCTIYKDLNGVPFSYAPILMLNVDRPYIRDDYQEGAAGYIMNYLHEISFYLSGVLLKDSICRQTLMPLDSGDSESGLGVDDYISFWEKVKYCPITRVNILPSRKEDLEKNKAFLARLDNDSVNVHVYFNLAVWDMIQIESVSSKYDGFEIELIGYSEDYLSKEIRGNQFKKNLLVRDMADMQENDLDADAMFPVLNDDNKPFFSNNVFTRKEDLFGCGKRDIFRNQKLNSNFYGKFLVLPNGHIMTNINARKALGTISDSVYEMIYKELMEGESWLRTRDKSGCRVCRYKYLCPSLSNYELYLKKDDLCFMG